MTLSRLITRSATMIVQIAVRRRSLALTLCSPPSSSAMRRTPIHKSNADPTSFRKGLSSRVMAKNVSPTRRTTAPSTPQRTPWRRRCGERLRHASAITTALSPDNTILTVMISRTASQNCGVPMSVMRPLSGVSQASLGSLAKLTGAPNGRRASAAGEAPG